MSRVVTHRINYDMVCELIFAPDDNMCDFLETEMLSIMTEQYGGHWYVSNTELTLEDDTNYYYITLVEIDGTIH